MREGERYISRAKLGRAGRCMQVLEAFIDSARAEEVYSN